MPPPPVPIPSTPPGLPVLPYGTRATDDRLAVILARCAEVASALVLVALIVQVCLGRRADWRFAAVAVGLVVCAAGLTAGARAARPLMPRPLRRRSANRLLLPMVIAALLMVTVSLLTPLDKVVDKADATKCLSNLRQLGQALLTYAGDNKGAFPPSWDVLLVNQDLSSELFVCPCSIDERARGDTPQEVARKLVTEPGHCSYVYLGRRFGAKTPPDSWAAYEPLTNHQGTGMHVLFADGHVEWLDRQEADEKLARVQAGYNPPTAR